jgi:hypothetical protein
MNKKLKIILNITSYLTAFILSIYIGIYHWNHDYLTRLQLFKEFYFEYFIITFLFLFAYFVGRK